MPVKNSRAYYTAFGKALEGLYQEEIITLAEGKNKPGDEFNPEVFERAAEWIRQRGSFTTDMLAEQPALDVINETFRVLGGAVSSSIAEKVPPELVGALENNAFVFSGFKTFHSLNEVGLSLVDDKGGIKPFEAFQKDVEKINARYNGNYLYAEYNHAVTSSQMAAKWHDFEKDGDRYNLQYRTAGDELVRAEHQALHNTTLPPDDPFWTQFTPPNGWNCRCTVVQVRKNRYPESDSAKATEIGETITADPKMQMFRFNPGKELKLYPDKHPYYKAPKGVKKVVDKLAAPIHTPEQAVSFVTETKERQAWFERGFSEFIVTTKKGVNGYTDMKGLIAMTKERMERVLSGLTKLRQGGKVTFDEADALATFWHEITHNRNKRGNMYRTTLETKYMELANEFVARNTLPEFYESFKSKLQHPEFIDNRASTGYNTWVRNYCTLINFTKANFPGVLDRVKHELFEGNYNEQARGLVKALKENKAVKPDGTRLKEAEIKGLVKDCLNYDEERYKDMLQSLFGE